MKKMLAFVLFVMLAVFVYSGCAPILVGVGAVGGYAIISEDTLQGEIMAPREDVVATSKDIVRDWKLDTAENSERSKITATSGNRRVWITIKPIGSRTVNITVQARKYGVSSVEMNTYAFPDIDTAKDIYEKILVPYVKKNENINTPAGKEKSAW